MKIFKDDYIINSHRTLPDYYVFLGNHKWDIPNYNKKIPIYEDPGDHGYYNCFVARLIQR